MSKRHQKETNILGALQAAYREANHITWGISGAANPFEKRRAELVKPFVDAAINVWIGYSLADYRLEVVEKDDESGQLVREVFTGRAGAK